MLFRVKLVFAGVLFAALPGFTYRASGQALMIRAADTFQGDDAEKESLSADSRDAASIAEPYDHAAKLVRPIDLTERTGPFSSVRIGVKADTLGAGLELSTPLSRHFGLRAGGNIFSFNYRFNIDGVDYNSRFNLRSGSANLDWFPGRGRFRIGMGVLYFNNTLSAISGVPPGNYFELGSQGFVNSVDDPLHGTAGVDFSRHVAPMVSVAYNLIGKRESSRITMPLELGVAYTGPAKIYVTLDGTACVSDGCFTFAENQEAQQSLQDEIKKLNNNLSSYPVYPIFSIGVTYRLGRR